MATTQWPTKHATSGALQWRPNVCSVRRDVEVPAEWAVQYLLKGKQSVFFGINGLEFILGWSERGHAPCVASLPEYGTPSRVHFLFCHVSLVGIIHRYSLRQHYGTSRLPL